MKKIIVMQSDRSAELWCKETLLLLGLESDDFAVEGDTFSLDRHLVPNERQLLITGSFSGLTEGMIEFVVKLRKKNSKLIIASYSINGTLPGPFDLHIRKLRDDGGFERCIRDFLSGKLVQATDSFWEPSQTLQSKIKSKSVRRKFVVVSDNVETLTNIKASIAAADPSRVEEIFFTRSPQEVVKFVGNSTTAVVITTDLFREEFDKNRHPWGGPNLASVLGWIKRGYGGSNTVLKYGWNPNPDQALRAVIRRPEAEQQNIAKHETLTNLILSFPRRFAGRKKSSLYDEARGIAKKFPVINIESCLNLRPATM